MNRPLQDKRPFGPVVDIDRLRQRMNNISGGKSVVGIAGTPMPQRPKNEMFISYLIEGKHVYKTKDTAKDIERKINARYDNYRVDFKKSGPSSKGDFEHQAVVVRIPGGELPFNDDDIHRMEDIINRNIEDINVVQIIIDQS